MGMNNDAIATVAQLEADVDFKALAKDSQDRIRKIVARQEREDAARAKARSEFKAQRGVRVDMSRVPWAQRPW